MKKLVIVELSKVYTEIMFSFLRQTNIVNIKLKVSLVSINIKNNI